MGTHKLIAVRDAQADRCQQGLVRAMTEDLADPGEGNT